MSAPDISVVHDVCEGRLVERARTVISMPEDQCWPRDEAASLPWCERCKCVVGLPGMMVIVHHNPPRPA